MAKKTKSAVAEKVETPIAATVPGTGNQGSIPALASKGAVMSLEDMLATSGAAAPKPKSATKVPILAMKVPIKRMVKDKETEVDALRLYVEAYKQSKAAEATMASLGADIATAVNPKRIEICRKDNQVHPSVNLSVDMGTDENKISMTATVQFTQSGAFHQILRKEETDPVEAAEGAKVLRLRETFKENYKTYFTVKSDVSVNIALLRPDLLKGIMELCAKTAGTKNEVKFKDLIQTKQTVIPSESLVNDMTLKPEVEALCEQVADILIPNKPSIKAK